jgi:hypothetical protein
MKRTVTAILSVVLIGVGLWVLTSSQTLDSACTLNARTGGGTSCVSGLPFALLGIALLTTGAVSMTIQLVASIRTARRRSIRREYPAITTLHEYEVESLRDVA